MRERCGDSRRIGVSSIRAARSFGGAGSPRSNGEPRTQSWRRVSLPVISYDEFVEQIARGSRQTLTTMGKSIGVKPHRRRGEWIFRDRTETLWPLRDVYERLQQTDKGIEWLNGPIRWAEESRQRAVDQRNAATAFLKERFAFLTDDFQYSPAFEIPAAEDTYIIAFRSDAAERQVEVSGRSMGSRFHCEIRRLIDGEPGSYETDSVAHAELERVREPNTTDEVYRSFEEDVAHTIALLRRHGDLLRGESWVEKSDIDDAFNRDFFERHGWTPSDEPSPGWLVEARKIGSVLVERHGFELVFDSDTLDRKSV